MSIVYCHILQASWLNCKVCGVLYPTKKTLASHMNVHAKTIPFKISDVRTVEKLPEPEMASALAQPPTGKFCQESTISKRLEFSRQKKLRFCI